MGATRTSRLERVELQGMPMERCRRGIHLVPSRRHGVSLLFVDSRLVVFSLLVFHCVYLNLLDFALSIALESWLSSVLRSLASVPQEPSPLMRLPKNKPSIPFVFLSEEKSLAVAGEF